MSGYSLSIDIGTTTTVAAVSGHRRAASARPRRRTEPRPLDPDGHPWVPSAVYLDAERGLLAGVEAMRLGRGDPERFEPNPKPHLDAGSMVLAGRPVPVMDVLAAQIGGCVERAAAQHGGQPPEMLVLTHPAGWGSMRRLVLRRAGHRFAGTVRLVAEPVAAATRVHALGAVPPRTPIVVFDVGGGSLDVAAVGLVEDIITVLAAESRTDLGGLAQDDTLLQVAMRRARLTDPDERTLASLREDVRLARESLPVDEVDIPLPPPLPDVHLSGAELTAALDPVLRRAVDVLAGVVEAAGLDRPVVLLTGGASRPPQLAKLIADRLGIEPITLPRPEATTCLGALTPGLAEPADTDDTPTSVMPVVPPPPPPSSEDGEDAAPRPPRHRKRSRWRRVLLAAVALALVAAAAAYWLLVPREEAGTAQRIAREAIPGAFDGLRPPEDQAVQEGFDADVSSLLCAGGAPPAPAEVNGRLAAAGSTLTERLGQVRRHAARLELDAVYLTAPAAGQVGQQVRDGVESCAKALTELRVLSGTADGLDVPAGRSWFAITWLAAAPVAEGERPVRTTCIVEIAGRLGLRSCATTDQGQVATTLLAVRGLNAMYDRA